MPVDLSGRKSPQGGEANCSECFYVVAAFGCSLVARVGNDIMLSYFLSRRYENHIQPFTNVYEIPYLTVRDGFDRHRIHLDR